MKGFEDFPQQYMPILIAMMIMAFAVAALVYILYLSNLYKLLTVIKPENRHIKPSAV